VLQVLAAEQSAFVLQPQVPPVVEDRQALPLDWKPAQLTQVPPLCCAHRAR
jgi:hypothetical protein